MFPVVVDRNNTIREWVINDYEEAVIKLCSINGREFIDLRKYRFKLSDGVFVPSKRGFCIELDDFRRRMLPYVLTLCGYDPKILNVDKSMVFN